MARNTRLFDHSNEGVTVSTHDSRTSNVEHRLVCKFSEVPADGSIRTERIGRQTVLLARPSADSEEVVAFAPTCPHANAPLRFGRVVSGEIICPWHFFRFDLTTGKPVACGESLMRLQTFSCARIDDEVHVAVTSESP